MTKDELDKEHLSLLDQERHLVKSLAVQKAKYDKVVSGIGTVLKSCNQYFESIGSGAVLHPSFKLWTNKDKLQKIIQAHNESENELRALRNHLKHFKV